MLMIESDKYFVKLKMYHINSNIVVKKEKNNNC